jgi:hypothetical protein
LGQPASALNTEKKQRGDFGPDRTRRQNSGDAAKSLDFGQREKRRKTTESSKAEFDNSTTLFSKSRKIRPATSRIDRRKVRFSTWSNCQDKSVFDPCHKSPAAKSGHGPIGPIGPMKVHKT